MIVDEPDGYARVNLVQRNGSAAVRDSRVEVSSPIVQQGDQMGAAFANLFSRLSDDADPVPILYLDVGTPDARIGILKALHGFYSARPANPEHGELFVASDGILLAADQNGVWVVHATRAQLDVVQAALNTHVARTDNPHNVTLTQLGGAPLTTLTNHINAANPHSGSASTTALNAHINAANPHSDSASQTALVEHRSNTNNPHATTAAQVGAMPLSGGIFSSGVYFASPYTSYNAGIQQEQDGSTNVFTIRTDGASRSLLRATNTYVPHWASNTSLPSDKELKEQLEDAKDEFMGLYELPLYTYKYKNDSGFHDGKRHFGFMAQDVEKVYPDVTWKRQDGSVEGVNKGELVPHLIAALQYERKEREKLETRLEKLEARLEALEKKETE